MASTSVLEYPAEITDAPGIDRAGMPDKCQVPARQLDLGAAAGYRRTAMGTRQEA